MIYQAPKLDDHEYAVIAAIDLIHERLRDRILVPAGWRGETYREIYVRTLEDGVARRERAPRVAGYNRAMTYVLRRRDDPHFRYDNELIRALHFMISEEDAQAWPGTWRARDAGVRDGDGKVIYRAPDADRVEGLMDEMVEWLNASRQTSAFVIAALAHLNICRIHPFRDGNGRLSRCLHALVIARAGYLAPEFLSIEEFIGHHRTEYETALASSTEGNWRPELDTRRWVRFCLGAHYRQALELLRRFEIFDRLCVELAADMTDIGSAASVAASEVFQAPSTQEMESWPRLQSGAIESCARLSAAFRFAVDGAPVAMHLNGAAREPRLAALLDQSLLSSRGAVPEPFGILASNHL